VRKLPAWLERARRLIVQPTQEWTTIAGEFTTAGPIYLRFLAPMAAIGPVAATLGTIISGGERNSLAGTYTMTPMDAVTSGVLEYGLNLAGVYLFAVVIEVLAGALGGQRNRVQALKVAAYGSAPYWLGGVLALLPKLSLIGAVFGLYSVRLFWAGLAPVMKTPRDKTVPFTLLVSLGGLLIVLLTSALSQLFIGR
jgi:Yip1-like protein